MIRENTRTERHSDGIVGRRSGGHGQGVPVSVCHGKLPINSVLEIRILRCLLPLCSWLVNSTRNSLMIITI